MTLWPDPASRNKRTVATTELWSNQTELLDLHGFSTLGGFALFQQRFATMSSAYCLLYWLS